MAKKPSNLIYDVTDKPPIGTGVLLGLQHVFVISVGWIFVVVIVRHSAAPANKPDRSPDIDDRTGRRHELQARPKRPVGSGYLCPLSVGPA